jgi:CubicO group peptidase (beta-lactamase class C family)
MSTSHSKLLALTTVSIWCVAIPDGLAGQASNTDRAVDAYVRGEMDRRRIPGLSLAVIHNGKIERLAGYGYADLTTREEATPSTVYQIASITKVFAGAAVMSLVEGGRLSLADSITKLVGGLPSAWAGITVWHCLTHMTGLADVSVDPLSGKFTPKSVDEAIASVVEWPMTARPGDTLVYQVIGYLLLGKVVERVTGLTPPEYLRQRFFEPLALRATRYASADGSAPHRAALYRVTDTFASRATPLAKAVQPTAFPLQSYDHMVRGLFSTVEDIAKWDVALSAGRVLKRATLRQMWTPARLNRGERAAAFGDPTMGYGGGWTTYHYADGQAVGHIGGNMAQYLRFLDRDLSVVVLTNSMNADAQSLAEGVARLYGAAAVSGVRPAQSEPWPRARARHHMVYDPATRQVLMIGGAQPTSGVRDSSIWIWSGTTWRSVASTLDMRVNEAVAFDSERRRLIVHGGGDRPDETSEWDGNRWTRLSVTGPGVRGHHSMVYDPARRQTILFGNNDATPTTDTWSWNGTAWSKLADEGPPARGVAGMAFDTKRGVAVLFGGCCATGYLPRGDTWEWDGRRWSQISTATAPLPRFDTNMAYDPERERIVLFGGRTHDSNLGDTWEYDGRSWTKIDVEGPPARNGHAMVYDPRAKAMLLFGGRNGQSAQSYFDDLWSFDGTWKRLGGRTR